jgi:phosphoserine phosphatase
MVQLILIRPGSTDYDLQSRIQGMLDVPLSENGQKDAAAAVGSLRAYLPKAIYACPCGSAQETAAIIGKALRLKPKSVDLLQNINLGLWQGMLVDEVRRKQPKVYKQWQEHPETLQPPDGETLADAVARIDEALEKLARKHKNATVALVVPEPLASIVRQRIDKKEYGDLWKAPNGCGHIDVLQVEPGFSETPHSQPSASPAPAASGSATVGPNGEANNSSTNGKSPNPSDPVTPPATKSRIVYRGVVVEGR